jgi:7-carboxy-7-deazaguanine synthase (Cx14CxxC type)
VSYAVKEIFLSLQGEGFHTGRAAVLCRFSGCNLACDFCDTDFRGTDGPGGGLFESAAELAATVAGAWRAPEATGRKFVVLTGGEPLLQVDAALVRALHGSGFAVAVETNGTLPAPPGLDWVCVSPKAGAELALVRGDELKLAYPQEDAPPERYEALAFAHFFLQPVDGPDRDRNARLAVEYCLGHPRWRLSLQTHKHLGIR